MPRASNGAYTLPAGNPVVTGTTITSTWANTTMSDIGSEITNSLDRQGRGSMLAAFKATDGTIAAPGIVFGSETTTGFSRPVAGNLAVSVLAAEVGRFTAAGLNVLGLSIGGVPFVPGNYVPLAGGVTMTGVLENSAANGFVNRVAGASRASYGLVQTGFRDWRLAIPASSTSFVIRDESGGVNRFVVDTTGRFTQNDTAVGIAGNANAALTLAMGTGAYLSAKGSGGQELIAGADASGVVLGSFSNHTLFLRANNTNAVWVPPSGDVGVGITPTAGLHVNKDSASYIAKFERPGVSSRLAFYSGVNAFFVDAEGASNTLNFATGGAVRQIINNSGDVGIGVSPAVRLHVESAGNEVARFVGGAGLNPFLSLYQGATRRGYIQYVNASSGIDFFNEAAGPLTFGTSGLGRAAISAAGVFTYGGLEIGYRKLNRVIYNSGASTLQQTDDGKCHYKGDATNVTVPSTLEDGTFIFVYNASGSARTLVQGGGLTMTLAGTASTGNRTIAANGFAAVWIVGGTNAVVWGQGLT